MDSLLRQSYIDIIDIQAQALTLLVKALELSKGTEEAQNLLDAANMKIKTSTTLIKQTIQS